MIPKELLIFIIVVAGVGIIGVIAFIIYSVLRPKLKDDKPSEEEILQDELNRVLQDVEDEKTAEQIKNYKEDDE